MMALAYANKTPLPLRLRRVLARLEQAPGVDEQFPRRPEAVAGLYKLLGDYPERAVELLLRADMAHHHCTGEARVFADTGYAEVCLQARRLPAHIEQWLDKLLMPAICKEEGRDGKPCPSLFEVGAKLLYAVN